MLSNALRTLRSSIDLLQFVILALMALAFIGLIVLIIVLAMKRK